MKMSHRYALFFLLFLALHGLAAQDEDCRLTTRSVLEPATAIPSVAYQPEQTDELYRFIRRQFKPSTRIVMIGEQHWMRSISELVTGLVLSLHEQAGFRNLVKEYPYSLTGFINAFINEPPGAESPYLELLRPIIDTEEEVKLLQTLRQWNADHPGQQLRVLCSDIEQDYTFPVLHVLLPGFRAMGDTTFLAHLRAVRDVDERLLAITDSLLAAMPADFRSGDHAFIDKQYIHNVADNLKSTYWARQKIVRQGEEKGFPAFMEARIARIIENLSAESVFGPYLRQEKTVCWGGANHFVLSEAKKGTYSNEGAYLARKFRGKVLTLSVAALGYQPPPAYYENEPETGLASFQMLISQYRRCFPQPDPEAFLLLGEPDPVTSWTLSNLQHTGGDRLIMAGRKNKTLQKLRKEEKIDRDYLGFDWLLFVRESGLFRVLP